MSTTRRGFIQASATALSALGMGTLAQAATSSGKVKPASKSLRLLILGGTGFIGPHMVRTALNRGHEVTIFNRGKSSTHLFPDLEKLKGDRDGDLESLKGRDWDAVIDNTGYVIRQTRCNTSMCGIFLNSVFTS
jgi:2'-hydroxyisoflavone reductase